MLRCMGRGSGSEIHVQAATRCRVPSTRSGTVFKAGRAQGSQLIVPAGIVVPEKDDIDLEADELFGDDYLGNTAKQLRHHSELGPAIFEGNPTLVGGPESARELGDKFIEFHLLVGSYVGMTSFEGLFATHLQQVFGNVELPSASNNAGADIYVNGKGWSLKSESASPKHMSRNKIHITRLMNAGWYSSQMSKATLFKEMNRIWEHMNDYEKIITLRCWQDEPWPDDSGREGMMHRYELYEIPKDVFKGFRELNPRSRTFLAGSSNNRRVEAKGPQGGDVKLTFSGGASTKVILDVDLTECVKHCTWDVPAPDPLPVHEV
jgi:hypothetical protein